MWFNGIDGQPVGVKKLPQKSLSGAHIQHRFAPEAAHERGDLLLATLGFAVKDVWAVERVCVAAMRRARRL
jgi:hypothetical protein